MSKPTSAQGGYIVLARSAIGLLEFQIETFSSGSSSVNYYIKPDHDAQWCEVDRETYLAALDTARTEHGLIALSLIDDTLRKVIARG